MKFSVRAVVFYTLAALCALMITGLADLAIYWFFTVAELTEFGSMPLFIIGLAITETSIAAICISMVSEDVLYYRGEYDEELTDDEKAT